MEILDRTQGQIEDQAEELDKSNQDETLNHKTLIEIGINQKTYNAKWVLPEMHRRLYRTPSSPIPKDKKHIHVVNSHVVKDSTADHLNKLRTKREIRRVSVDIIVHAGANLKMNAGSITYLIPAKSTPTQTAPTVPNPDLTTNRSEHDPHAITSAVTAVASVFGVLAFIAVATVLGNV